MLSRESFEAMVRGRADICFLAIEPGRAAEAAFTAPWSMSGSCRSGRQ
jgi:polar amino acid transport system substrate-binding protein